MLQAAQLPFSLMPESPYEAALCDLEEDGGGQITAVGFERNIPQPAAGTESHDDPFAYLAERRGQEERTLRLIRLDAAGNVTMERSVNIGGVHRAVSLLPAPHGGYVVGGYTRNGELFVAGLDHGGGIRFVSRFGTAKVERMQRLLLLRDGGLLAVGSSFTSRDSSGDPFMQGVGGSDLYLVRLSPSGQILWSRKYGTVDDDSGVAAAEAGDGTLVVAGTTERDGERSAFLMRLTENGEKIWMMPYPHEGSAEAHDLILLRNGTFAASLSLGDAPGGRIRLITFDLQRTLLGAWDAPEIAGGVLASLAERSDGSLVGVGYTTDGKRGDSDALAVRFSPDGRVLWQQRFGGPNRDRFNSVRVLRDGRAVAVGVCVPGKSEVGKMWIAALPEAAAAEMEK